MIGQEIHRFAQVLWTYNRSLTGEGVRQTLQAIQSHLPELAICGIPSGTPVFDWTVPREWCVKQAYILAPGGKKVCDFAENNLHLVGYSVPFRGRLSLDALQSHLYSLPELPDAIPYITSYYKERWGFCLSHRQREQLPAGDYEVVIESELFDGVLNYGELVLKGESEQEIFLSTYVCHPSMANNELSGPAVVTFLAKWLSTLATRRYTYRIIFIPETIGSISYLSRHHREMKARVIAGFNVTCIGDDRAYSFLPSRRGDTLSDRVAQHVLAWIDPAFVRYGWRDRGSDERQYCAPGIDLPVASIMRTKYGRYPEYHTSLDNLTEVVTPAGLQGGYTALQRSLELLENNEVLQVQVLCEPQMGKRGLYPTLSTKSSGQQVRQMMDLISYCDGQYSLLDIAEKLEVPCWDLYETVALLKQHDLIRAKALCESVF